MMIFLLNLQYDFDYITNIFKYNKIQARGY